MNKNIQPKVKEILIADDIPGAKKSIFCETFVYQPENIEEALLGDLYIVGRLQSTPSDSPSHIINLLASIIKREYYKQPQKGPEAGLREGLKRANAAIADLIKTKNIDWLSKTNFGCVALSENALYLTKIGNAKILLIRNNRITDLSKKLIPSQDKPTPQKAFQSIASGKLFLGDKIILVADDILQIVSSKGLKQIFDLEPTEQIQQLKKVLGEIPRTARDKEKGAAPQGMIVIEMAPGERILAKSHETINIPLPQPPQTAAQDSRLAPFLEKSKDLTSELNLVSSGYLFKFKEKIKILRDKLKNYKEKLVLPKLTFKTLVAKLFAALDKTQKPKQEPTPPETILSLESVKKPEEQPGPELIRDISIAPEGRITEKKELIPAAGIIKRASTQRLFDGIKPRVKTFVLKVLETARSTQPQKIKIRRETRRRVDLKKIAILALFAVVVAAAIGYTYHQKYQNEIIYFQETAKQAQEDIKQINKIEELGALSPFANFDGDDQKFAPSHIFLNRDNILAAGSGSNLIAVIPTKGEETNKKSISSALPQDKIWRQISIYNEDTIILLDDQNRLYQYNFANDKFSELKLKLPTVNPSVIDLFVYNDYLYLLDSQNSEITRCSLDMCRLWLTEKQDLSQAMSLAIDGSIYLPKADGLIDVFYAGKKEKTFEPKIRPVLNKGQIYTKRDFKNIYLLDDEEKRIVIVSKEGELIKQLYSQEFSGLKDIAITDDEKTLFVLDGTTIYKIDLVN